MDRPYVEDQVFEKKDFRQQPLAKAEYDNCHFVHCQLDATDLSEIHFADCRFDHCNLSNAKLVQTAFKNCKFKDCKLMGLLFDTCSEFLFEVDFENCTLNFSSFGHRKMKKTSWRSCLLQEVDFTGADLSAAVFSHSTLTGSRFENTILEKTDFRTATQFSIDPEINKMKKSRFSADGALQLLDKYDIVIGG
ncbi:pentapeptide repeat-containing protein [Nostoc ellipsosporum NOK]|nr:pentapeptide repeat-containing protein [Nostoc ellipsosporum NOK]